ncbi:oxysterol binding family protein [Tieghemostelium lacteum]|uniref:Oxysterol binding family protein n=1 Tax=Tieghemostelium lacteum TaxID=361077 RepID=A0A151ZA42_TIELA|nr:oxysterol binding family protein [Tieghemostelium lacteum]|eukprot:KYQ90821.1 oxysterol binding family protein [Tieghemostelium lacteum]
MDPLPCINNIDKMRDESTLSNSITNSGGMNENKIKKSGDKIEQQQQQDAIPSTDDQTTEVLEEEPRNLLISLLSELKIGVDLSKVPLPTFILEPRSLLEKFTDFMIHGDLLCGVSKLQDPLDRIHQITKWYLSGFYFRPKGVKKPYNPILGEIFRSRWDFGTNSNNNSSSSSSSSSNGNGNNNEGTTAFLVAEQISHHPPVSCVYISNRKDGYTMSGIINPRSKFLGTSMAVIVDGSITLTLHEHQEEYVITFPTAYARGILFGTLLTEICGSTSITCKNTQYKTELDFKSKPFFGGEYNVVTGKIKKKSETFYQFSGKWDDRIDITNTKKKTTETFWDVSAQKRTPRIVRALQDQVENESQRLWQKVTQAIIKKDQKEATVEKNRLEDEQRKSVRQRKEQNIDWEPKYFKKVGDQWVYKYSNTSLYSPSEPIEIEENGIIQFKNSSSSSSSFSSPSSSPNGANSPK